MPNPPETAVGRELRRLRRVVDMTQAALSDLSGVDIGTISRIESGKTKQPGQATLAKLDKALAANGQILFIATGVTPSDNRPPDTAHANQGNVKSGDEGSEMTDDLGSIARLYRHVPIEQQAAAILAMTEALRPFLLDVETGRPDVLNHVRKAQ